MDNKFNNIINEFLKNTSIQEFILENSIIVN